MRPKMDLFPTRQINFPPTMAERGPDSLLHPGGLDVAASAAKGRQGPHLTQPLRGRGRGGTRGGGAGVRGEGAASTSAGRTRAPPPCRVGTGTGTAAARAPRVRRPSASPGAAPRRGFRARTFPATSRRGPGARAAACSPLPSRSGLGTGRLRCSNSLLGGAGHKSARPKREISLK